MSAAPKIRDPRLDFFRGAAMFIIFIAHTDGTWLWDWIPARFGLSDAAHLFVFCSGYAAAIAFGGTFLRDGFAAGSARILLRCAQLYAAHICLFVAVAALCILGSTSETDYAERLGIGIFFEEPKARLVALLTLAWVPQYFDILPLYMVVLAMVPPAMLLARVHPGLVVAMSAALYGAAWIADLNFSGDPTTARGWFFDPFAWQLVFFTGFALSRRWVAPPPRSRALLGAASAYLGLGMLITLPSIYEAVPPLSALRDWVLDHADKTRLDLLAYAHFLASAYVVVVLLKGREQLLLSAVTRPIFKCGQQALSVFVGGIFLSQLASMAFERLGTDLAAQIVVNGAGFAALIAIAYAAAWFKAPPWKRKAAPLPIAEAAPVPLAAAAGAA